MRIIILFKVIWNTIIASWKHAKMMDEFSRAISKWADSMGGKD